MEQKKNISTNRIVLIYVSYLVIFFVLAFILDVVLNIVSGGPIIIIGMIFMSVVSIKLLTEQKSMAQKEQLPTQQTSTLQDQTQQTPQPTIPTQQSDTKIQ